MSDAIPIPTPSETPKPGGGSALTVVIADPHAAFREALRKVVSHHAHLLVVAEAGDLARATSAVRRHRAGVLVLDMRLFAGGRPTLGPLPAHTAIVVVGMSDAQALAEDVLVRGAHAYVVKDQAHAVLAAVLRRAATARCEPP
jgi:DNA-binding NarL/FixJ family response regulator